MRKLKPVIEVQELPTGFLESRQHLPSLRDLASPVASEHEATIIDYLFQGAMCVWCPTHGSGSDLVGMRRIREVCQSDPHLKGMDRLMGGWFTDGTWMWDGILPYYIAAYHIRLPDEFVRFAEASGWKIDEAKIDLKQLDATGFDVAPAPAHA